MSDTTAALTGLSVQQVTDRLSTADAFLQAKGWIRTPKVIALPGSSKIAHRTDANVLAALSNLGYVAAIDKFSGGGPTGTAAINGRAIDPIYGISLNPYRVPAWGAENTDLLTQYQAHLRHAIKAGGPRILRTGAIAGAGVDGQIDPADHTALLGEISLKHHAGTVACLPWRKFYSGLSGRISR